jgi:hypothetical protein
MFKADIFIPEDEAWSEEELARARPESFDLPEGPVVLRIASAEDTLLHKLLWYRLGKQLSDRQWDDILGILRIQGDTLDREYLDRWAARLHMTELLAAAMLQR